MNKATVIGNLGSDPIVRKTNSGLPVANFSMATNESRTKDGKTTKYTEWHRVVAFGPLAEIIGNMYKKGKQCVVEGRMQTREWKDKNEITRSTTEIVASYARLLGPAPAQAVAQGPSDADVEKMAEQSGVPNDDIPFD